MRRVRPIALTVGSQAVGLHRTFAEAPASAPFLLINSAGYLEVAVPHDRADERTGLTPGTFATLTLSP